MAVRVYIDGAIHDETTATVSVFDRGFLYGDNVYEVLRTAGARPLDLERHLTRLERSAAAIALAPPSREVVASAIDRALTAANNEESYIRVIVSRGVGELGLDVMLADRPRLIVIVRELGLPPQRYYDEGVAVRLVGVQRTSPRAVDPSVKSGNYLNNILALHEARRQGAYEALMCNAAGHVAEGASSNLFVVQSGQLITPALRVGLLAGITRQRVMELAADAGLAPIEEQLSPRDVCASDEAFLTSSIRGVMPIARIDDVVLAGGCPGPVSKQLMSLYAAFVRDHARQAQRGA